MFAMKLKTHTRISLGQDGNGPLRQICPLKRLKCARAAQAVAEAYQATGAAKRALR